MRTDQKRSIDMPEDDIRSGKVCPYCGIPPSLTESKFGKRWSCYPCEAYVGVHSGTEIPLGSLADAKLRERRVATHEYFDSMWRFAMLKRSISKSVAREAAYAWLASEMGMLPVECHIGMMDLEECALAIKLCKPYFKEKNYI